MRQAGPASRALRRFALGGGPLKRGSDRVEFLSRLAALIVMLLAVPVAISLATVSSADLAATAREQAAERTAVTAVIVARSGTAGGTSTYGLPARATATWTAPDGLSRRGVVPVQPGTTVGQTVAVWIDGEGRLTTRPLARGDVLSYAVLMGAGALLVLTSGAAIGHLLVCRLLWRYRARRWETGWAAVEPVWAGRADH